MQLYHGLYVGEKAKKKRYKIVWKLKHNAGLVNVYVITIASNERNLLDIYPSWILMQPHFIKEEFFIVGIACGYEEAVCLVQTILENIYRETGGFDVRNYIMK